VGLTGQPYAFSKDDPLNATDPDGAGAFGPPGTPAASCNGPTIQSCTASGSVPAGSSGPANPSPTTVVADQAVDLAHQPQGVDSSYNQAEQTYSNSVTPGSRNFSQNFYYTVSYQEGVVPVPVAFGGSNQYAVVGFGGCIIVCFSVETDGLSISASVGGVGFEEKGVFVGESSEALCDRSHFSTTFGGGIGGGGQVTSDLGAPGQPEAHEWDFGQFAGFESSFNYSYGTPCL
jgi:hypothetical protein